MPIPAPLLPVHGVLGEDGVEHVGAVDLAGEVAVVAGVVAAEEVAEGGLAVACWGISSGGFWFWKGWVGSCGVGGGEGKRG